VEEVLQSIGSSLSGNAADDNALLAAGLRELGYNDVRVRTALGACGEGLSSLRNLRHVFLTLQINGGWT
jgi:hypothetical protein